MTFLQLLTIAYTLELGGMPYSTTMVWRDTSTINASCIAYTNQLYSTLGFKLQAYGAYIGGAAEIYTTPLNARQYSPTAGRFDFSLGYKWRGVEAGFTHSCYHMISSDSGDKARHFNFTKMQEGHEKFFIKISGSSKIF